MRIVALVVALGASGSAAAGGYYYSDSGIVATGRGGAWVAGADTQFAQRFNPAGLIRIEHPTLNVGWSGVQQSITFDRLANDGTFMEPAKNQAAPFSVPQIGFATPLWKDKLALAVGFFSPFAPSSDYAADGPQRYTIINTTIWQFSVGPAVAFQPIEQLTIGLGVYWNFMRVEEQLVVTTSGPRSDGSDNEAGDVLIDAAVWDLGTPWVNFGVLVEPVPWLSIGASVEPPAKYQARGPATLDFTGHGLEGSLDQVQWSDDDVRLAISLPWLVRAGVAVRPVEALEIEAAFVWEQWSALGAIQVDEVDVTVTGLDGFINEEVEPIEIPVTLTDVWSVRLGAEYRAHEMVEVRAGAFFEKGSQAEDFLSVALLDSDKLQTGVGASTFLIDERLRFDAAFAWIFFPSQEIRSSQVTQINVYGGNEGVVGNGDLRAHGWVVGLQAAWAFKRFEKKKPAETGDTE